LILAFECHALAEKAITIFFEGIVSIILPKKMAEKKLQKKES
jgi:hypothetical protein